MLIPLNKETITIRLDDSTLSITKLEELAKLSYEQFIENPDNFALASFHLQRTLENILSIGAHILSRLDIEFSVSEYANILPDLAKAKIIPQKFADRNQKLGNYRNRLVHGYLKITPREMYDILQTHLVDLKQFGQIINDLINDPSKFDLKIE